MSGSRCREWPTSQARDMGARFFAERVRCGPPVFRSCGMSGFVGASRTSRPKLRCIRYFIIASYMPSKTGIDIGPQRRFVKPPGD
jgi:hypothetical protein